MKTHSFEAKDEHLKFDLIKYVNRLKADNQKLFSLFLKN